MRRDGLILVISIILAVVVFAVGAAVAEDGVEFNPYIGMKENLLRNIGKRIAVRITTGEPIEGTIVKVGDQNVHLSKLAGRDYYDAIVRIDKIEAIIFKAR